MNLNQEPGIIRNSVGRITETGWPEIPVDKWPLAHAEISAEITKQVKYDSIVAEILQRHGTDRYGAVPLAHYYVRGTVLSRAFSAAVQDQIKQTTDQDINVCDIGGGDGTLLGRVLEQFNRQNSLYDTGGKTIRATLTRLVDFGLNQDATIDRVSHTPVELPPDDFYEAFHVVTSQNSIYHWSRFPEVATLNVTKMLKPGGIFLTTAPFEPVEVRNDPNFDMFEYLKNNPYLKLLGVNNSDLEGGSIMAFKKDLF
jgi:2-polyprenyl-3-methyl-5-hydroxy-6-metoxy-1,4-benzoquinol methylase